MKGGCGSGPGGGGDGGGVKGIGERAREEREGVIPTADRQDGAAWGAVEYCGSSPLNARWR